MTSVRRTLKNVIKNYTPCECMVREATSNDPWGASASLLSGIADLTYNELEFEQIMTMIWKRLHDHGKNWRHVYKALVLLEYLMKLGHINVIADLQDNIFAVQSLRDFQYIDESGKDYGMNVRERSKAIVALVSDPERLNDERERAAVSRERVTGAAIVSQPPMSRGPQRFSEGGRDQFSRHSDDDVMRAAMQRSLEDAGPQRSPLPRNSAEEDEHLQLALALSKSELEAKQQQPSGGARSLQPVPTIVAPNMSPNTARRIQVRTAEEAGDDIWAGAAVVARAPSAMSDASGFLEPVVDGVQGTHTPPRSRSPAVDPFGMEEFRPVAPQQPKSRANNPFF